MTWAAAAIRSTTFDIMSNRGDVKEISRRSRAYYAGSLRESGLPVDDEEVAFQEAAAEYVGHRASSYWAAFASLIFFEKLLNDPPKAGVGRAVTQFKTVPSDYNAAMATRRMGYQMAGGWGAKVQDPLTKNISPELRGFCDRVLLERRVPDHFASAKELATKYNAIVRKHPQL